MQSFSQDAHWSIWIEMMEQLNASSDLYAPIPGILAKLCKFLGFGCGFIYRVSYKGDFELSEKYAVYSNNHLHQTLNLAKEIGPGGLEQLTRLKTVSFTANSNKAPLEQKLADLFMANSMVLVPIESNGKLIAFLGVVDRRGVSRIGDHDIDFSYAVLAPLANHVKLSMYQARINKTQRALEHMLDNTGVDMVVTDYDTFHILYANKSLAEPYGGRANLLGRPCWSVLMPGNSGPCSFCPRDRLLQPDGSPAKPYSWDFQRPGGKGWYRITSAATHWVDGRMAQIASCVDITENKRNEELIRYAAEYDELTALPNRFKLRQDCEQSLLRAKESGKTGYLLFFDLDGFKAINDNLGHSAGDDLLSQIGAVLKLNPATSQKSYRHGGDEFVILCEEETLDGVNGILLFLERTFNQRWALLEGETICRTSIGITSFPHDADTAQKMLAQADKAMYAAKRQGSGLAYMYDNGRITPFAEYFAAHCRS